MPVTPLNNTTQGAVGPGILDPGVAGRQQLVAPGNRFNGLTVLAVPVGLQFFVQFGANTRIGPITDAISITFTDVPASDVEEGVWAEVDTPVPGGVVPGWISYAEPGRGGSGGISGVGAY